MSNVSDWNSIRVNQSYSEPFRNVSEPFGLIPNEFEKYFVSPLMKTVKNKSDSIRFIPLQSEASIQMNANQAIDLSQSESILLNPGSK